MQALSLLSPPPLLTVTDTPTPEQLQVWWHAMKSDDLSVAYADDFPDTLTDFCDEISRGEKLLLLCFVHGEIAGAVWMHDLARRDDGSVAAGWIGCYFLLQYRGHFVAELWPVIRHHWEARGIRHFFSAVHVANRQSRIVISQCARFRRVGKFPSFMQLDGQPADVFIYTWHAEDTELAWELATARASRQMSCVA